jgi:hypothetical protein
MMVLVAGNIGRCISTCQGAHTAGVHTTRRSFERRGQNETGCCSVDRMMAYQEVRSCTVSNPQLGLTCCTQSCTPLFESTCRRSRCSFAARTD